jgi:hypothetical protein
MQPIDVLRHGWKRIEEIIALRKAKESTADPPGIDESLVESLCLHVRNVIEILTDWGHQKDMVRLSKIATNFRSPRIEELRKAYVGEGTQVEGSPYFEFHKMILHPSEKRMNARRFDEPFSKVLPLIQSLRGELEKHISPTFKFGPVLNGMFVTNAGSTFLRTWIIPPSH